MRETRLEQLVDATIERNGGVKRRVSEKKRGHLGASIIGKECWRQIYYDWRWATDVKPKGRMQRLWERGHREEPAFIEWLESVGAQVRYIDWDRSAKLYYHDGSDCYFVVKPGEPEPEIGSALDIVDDVSQISWHVLRAESMGVEVPEPKQFGFSALWGHFSGSLDGLATGVPYANHALPDLRPDEEILVEFKTHNDNSFKKLVEEGVKKAKPEHYVQMTTYMEQKGLRLALYCAVNKNDDNLYYAWVFPDVAAANEAMLKAQALLSMQKLPDRISNSPSFWKCRFCDHRLTCHYGEPMVKHCRTCKMAQPVDNAEWKCHKWNAIIPFDAQQIGCAQHSPVTD